MKTTIRHGQASVHRDKGVGSHVTISITGEAAGEWDGIYRFGSHGMTADEFVARVSELKAYHAAKMERLNGFRELKMRDIFSGGERHRIIDANLIERGSDVELRLGVYLIGPLGHQHQLFTMNRHDGLVYPNVEAVPSDAKIFEIVSRRIVQLRDAIAAHESFVAQLGAVS